MCVTVMHLCVALVIFPWCFSGEGYIEVNEGAEYDDNGVVELGGMEIQAADPGDVEKVDKSQILQLRQKLDSDLQIVTDIDQLLDRGKVTTVMPQYFLV